MQIPRLASLVTSFHIRFPYCENQEADQDEGSPCKCNILDKFLEMIITPLSNLRRLYIHCSMCRHNPNKRHAYLQRLETRHLSHFSLECDCLYGSNIDIFQIFTAPCMQTVKSLEWKGLEIAPSNQTQLALVKSEAFLPHVTTLFCSSPKLIIPLLQKGAITSLTCNPTNATLPVRLVDCPPSLLHLHCTRLDIFIPYIVKDSSPYRNLRSMGGFIFDIGNVSRQALDKNLRVDDLSF